MGALAVRTVTTRTEFARLAEPWDALVHAMPRPCPYLLHGWIDAWWETRGDGADVRIAVASRDGVPVGGLPLVVQRRVGLRIARIVGDGGYGVQLADVLLTPGEPAETAAALVAHAAPSFDCAELRHVPATGVLARLAGRRDTMLERLPALVLEARPGWEARIPAKVRREVQRMRRRLAETGRVEIVVARRPDELRAALHDAFAVHARRWEGRFDGSDFGTADGRRFEEAALAALAARDVARFVTLKVDGRPIAFNYYFALGARMIGHRLAFDPAFGRFSPGQLNLLDTIGVATADGLATIEFLGGDERYKAYLADRRDPLCELVGMAQGARAEAYVRARTTALRLRRRLKQSPALRSAYLGAKLWARRLRTGRSPAPTPAASLGGASA